MEEFQVPSRKVAARILLDDGRTLDCEIYVALAGVDGGPQRVFQRLNDPSEEFIPVAQNDDRFLLNKSGIVTVEITDPVEVDELDAEVGRQVPVRLGLTGGINLLGRFHIVMRPEESRVLDFLNQAPRFTTLLGETKATFVQRNYVVTVRGQE